MSECPLCQMPPEKHRTHQHGPHHFRSPSRKHAGLWHDVTWSEEFDRWRCDTNCFGGHTAKVCHHVSEVNAILRDEHAGWLGEVPVKTEKAQYCVYCQVEIDPATWWTYGNICPGCDKLHSPEPIKTPAEEAFDRELIKALPSKRTIRLEDIFPN